MKFYKYTNITNKKLINLFLVIKFKNIIQFVFGCNKILLLVLNISCFISISICVKNIKIQNFNPYVHVKETHKIRKAI